MGDVSDVVILGAGPAGLSAAIYAARGGLSLRVLEKLLPGGQVTNTDRVENYLGFPQPIPGGELASRMAEHAARFGINPEMAEALAVRREDDLLVVKTPEGEVAARTVIVCTGARQRKLGVPGEEELRGGGVSYCATCDGFFFKNQEVVVVGGGDSALEEAIYLSGICKKVRVIHRRDALRAVRALQDEAFSRENIEFVWNTVVEEILGEEGKVRAVRTKNVKTGEVGEIATSAVFIYVGLVPNSDCVKELCELDEAGFVKTDMFMHTSARGVFAAGDVRAGNYRQIAMAVGDGATAATSAIRYCLEG